MIRGQCEDNDSSNGRGVPPTIVSTNINVISTTTGLSATPSHPAYISSINPARFFVATAAPIPTITLPHCSKRRPYVAFSI